MEAQMTVKTTLSFTDRHHHFLSEKVGQGVFATQSAAVAAALEQMMGSVAQIP
jgi:Arc/MetJ-type ribon-helix-helix transcriptional regulator